MSNYKDGLSNTKEYRKEYNKQYRLSHKEYFKKHKRKSNLKLNYNITIEEYDQMLKDQNFKCAICGIHISKLLHRLYVDHNHETGEIRGLLCHKCNTGIGMFKENKQIMTKAIKYL